MFFLFLICKKKRISFLTFAEDLSLVRFILILVLDIALFSILSLCSLSLESLSLSERRFSRRLLFCPVGIVALGVVNVGVDNLFGYGNGLNILHGYGLVTAVERYECCGNCSLIVLSVVRSVICRGREFLLNLGNSGRSNSFFGIVRLYVCIYSVCRLIPRGCLLRLLKRLFFLSLLFHSSSKTEEFFTLCASVGLRTLYAIVYVGGHSLRINCNAGCLKITNAVCLYICICGNNNAYRRLVALAVRYEQYYLFTRCRAGKRSGIVITVNKGAYRNSLDHDCILVTLIALSSSLILESLSLFLVSSKEFCSLNDTGVAPLCFELFFKLLSRLDSENVVALKFLLSLLFSLCRLEKLFCLFDTGVNLLLLLNLFGL